jgi:hypothetical protein
MFGEAHHALREICSAAGVSKPAYFLIWEGPFLVKNLAWDDMQTPSVKDASSGRERPHSYRKKFNASISMFSTPSQP